jgi:hypothetical protein
VKGLSAEAIVRGLRRYGVSSERARALIEAGQIPEVEPRLPRADRVRLVTPGLDGEARHVDARVLPDGGLHLVIPYPPRTKKSKRGRCITCSMAST